MRLKPKIVFFDIETLPYMRKALKHWPRLSGFYDRTFKSSVQSIACASIKELGKKTKTYHAWDYKQAHKNDDKKLCEILCRELSDADVIVTHNGIKFDIPFLQGRLAINKLTHLPNIKQVDTLVIARRKYSFISNRLGDLAEELGLKYRKRKHDGWELWERLWDGEAKAKAEMSIYNRYDVLVLEEIFKVFRPLVKNISYNSHDRCPCCGSKNQTKWGFYRGLQRYMCKACGHISTKTSSPKAQFKSL